MQKKYVLYCFRLQFRVSSLYIGVSDWNQFVDSIEFNYSFQASSAQLIISYMHSTIQIYIHIYFACLGAVCLFVCLFVSNKRQNGWTDRAKLFCETSRVAKTFLKKSVHFQRKSVQFSKKNSVQSVQFLKKNPYNPYIFLKKIRTIFEKIRTISTIFEKKSLQSVHKTIFENIIQHCLTPPIPHHLFLPPTLPSATNDVPSNNLYSW